MAGLTRYNRYPRDYLGGTRTLSLEAKGLYNDLIDTMYDTGRPLPYDVQHLCRLCGVRDKRTLLKPLNELIEAGKIRVLGDVLVNDRTMSEIEEATQHIENGRTGGRPRNSKEPSQSADSSLAVPATASEPQANSKQTPIPSIVQNQQLNRNPPTPTPRPIEEEERSAGASGHMGVLIDVMPATVTIAEAARLHPSETLAPDQPEFPPGVGPGPSATVVPPPYPMWRRIIRAFDDIREQVFGEHMARMCPAALDKTHAERWVNLGVDEDLVRAVFLKKCTDFKKNKRSPPDTLKFCNRDVEDAIAERRQIENKPFEGRVHHGKRAFGIDAGPQSAHGALFAAAAVVDAQLRKAKSHA